LSHISFNQYATLSALFELHLNNTKITATQINIIGEIAPKQISPIYRRIVHERRSNIRLIVIKTAKTPYTIQITDKKVSIISILLK